MRSLAFDSSNEWFVTGSADRTIKFWNLATGQLRLTLTGHIEQVGQGHTCAPPVVSQFCAAHRLQVNSSMLG